MWDNVKAYADEEIYEIKHSEQEEITESEAFPDFYFSLVGPRVCRVMELFQPSLKFPCKSKNTQSVYVEQD